MPPLEAAAAAWAASTALLFEPGATVSAGKLTTSCSSVGGPATVVGAPPAPVAL
jgi:hypothetical protein